MVPRRAKGAVLAAIEQDLKAWPTRPGQTALVATALVLARVLDDEKAPATAKVAASKTLTDVLVRLAGPSVAPAGGGDAVERIRGARSRRRGAAT